MTAPRFRMIELRDEAGLVTLEPAQQPMVDDVFEYATFRGRLFRLDGCVALDDGGVRAEYWEIPALRVGAAIVQVDNVEGVPVAKIVEALAPSGDAALRDLERKIAAADEALDATLQQSTAPNRGYFPAQIRRRQTCDSCGGRGTLNGEANGKLCMICEGEGVTMTVQPAVAFDLEDGNG